MNRMTFFPVLILFLFLMASVTPALTNEATPYIPVESINHNGISISAKEPSVGAVFDVPILKSDMGMKNLVNALDLLIEKSPFSAAQIETLKKNGLVSIVYDPGFPYDNSEFTTIQFAAFRVNSIVQDNQCKQKKLFPVVVGRHGIKLPVTELASTLAHELVGHGVQYLEGRVDVMRSTDRECEAWLYEELAHQDFGLDKFSAKMIEFRKQLALNCDAFLRHLRQNDPEGLVFWKVLNPDVPKLLAHMASYLDVLRSRGEMQVALKIAQDKRNKGSLTGEAPDRQLMPEMQNPKCP